MHMFTTTVAVKDLSDKPFSLSAGCWSCHHPPCLPCLVPPSSIFTRTAEQEVKNGWSTFTEHLLLLAVMIRVTVANWCVQFFYLIFRVCTACFGVREIIILS